MLLIGTVLSLFTAVARHARACSALLAGFRWFDNPRFMGATGAADPRAGSRSTSSGKRRIWFAISARARLIAIVSLGRQGPQPRHRLQGRHADHLQDARSRPRVEQVRERRRRRSVGADAVVQGRGQSVDGDSYTSFQIRTESLHDRPSRTALQQRAHRATLERRRRSASQTVSASFGGQIARSAIIAIIVSLAPDRRSTSRSASSGKFARPGDDRAHPRHPDHARASTRSTGREVTTATVAAVLTDPRLLDLRHDHRLRPHARERAADATRRRFAAIANLSLWETIRRSLATTLHHAAPDRLAAALRRRHAEGLRVRAAGRHRLRRLLVDLHRHAARSTVLKEREPEFARRRDDRPPRTSRQDEEARPRAEPEVAEGGPAGRGRERRRRSAGRDRAAPDEAVPCTPATGSRGRARAAVEAESARRQRRRVEAAWREPATAAPTRPHDEHARRRSRRGRPRRGRRVVAGAATARTRARRRARRARCGVEPRRRARACSTTSSARWRGEACAVGERGGRRARGLSSASSGSSTRDELEELELRVAQLEHRLRLLEERRR